MLSPSLQMRNQSGDLPKGVQILQLQEFSGLSITSSFCLERLWFLVEHFCVSVLKWFIKAVEDF